MTRIQTSAPSPTPTSLGDLFKVASTSYGPTAFGLVCFLSIWFAAVKPTLENNRVDTAKIQLISDKLMEAAQVQNNTAQLLKPIAERLERLADRLDLHSKGPTR